MTAPAPMTEAQFIASTQIYGGDPTLWPDHIQAAARLTERTPAAQAALDEAAALDALLFSEEENAERDAAAPADLTTRILADAARETETRAAKSPTTERRLSEPAGAHTARRPRARPALRRSARPPSKSAAAAAALLGAMAAGLVLGFFAPQWAQSVAPFVAVQVADADAADPYGYDAYDGIMSAAEGWMDG